MSVVVCILLFVPLLVKASAIGDRAEPINVCQTEDCKKSAQRILDYMESTVEPCDDFYRFSCGTFLGGSAIKDDERNISITQMRRKVEAQLLDILQAPIDPGENRAFQIIKNYTHLCMKYEMSDEREVVERRALLEAAGGWPVLGDWSAVAWSLQDTVVGLRAAGVDTDGLLDIYVDVDDRNHSRARLHGSEYDSEGELRNWWKASTKEMFDQKKKCFIYQYNGYKDNTTVINVNGTFTQGENIADNAGIKLAYRAYRALAAQRDTPEPALPGLEQYSADQLFFMSMGNVWCTRAGRDALESMLLYDPHSPPEFRVNGVSSNLDVFGRAFHCERDDPMSRRAKCDLW